jgi:hypothetical protein
MNRARRKGQKRDAMKAQQAVGHGNGLEALPFSEKCDILGRAGRLFGISGAYALTRVGSASIDGNRADNACCFHILRHKIRVSIYRLIHIGKNRKTAEQDVYISVLLTLSRVGFLHST